MEGREASRSREGREERKREETRTVHAHPPSKVGGMLCFVSLYVDVFLLWVHTRAFMHTIEDVGLVAHTRVREGDRKSVV